MDIPKEPRWDRIIVWAPKAVESAEDMAELMWLPRDGWRGVPHLRKSVIIAAVLRCSRDKFGAILGLHEEALTLSLEYFGLAEDSPDANNSPGTIFMARMRAWKRHSKSFDRESPTRYTFLAGRKKENR